MTNGLPTIIFNQTKDDIYAAEYAAHLSIICYRKLQTKINEYKDTYKGAFDEKDIELLLSPEVIAQTIQVAYNEVYELKNKKSALLKNIPFREYEAKYKTNDKCQLYNDTTD